MLKQMRPYQSLSILLPLAALGSMRAAAQENWTHNVPFEAYKPNYALEGQPEMKIPELLT